MKTEIRWVTLIKLVPGLPYAIGDMVPVSIDRHGQFLWHVWTTMITLPNDAIRRVEGTA